MALNMFDLAHLLFDREAAASSGTTTTLYGTAVSDSTDGRVDVVLDGNVIADGSDDNVLNMDAVVAVSKNDRVIITIVDGVPVVTGVIGYGDSVSAYMTELADLADRADTAAQDAQKLADEAKEVADATDQHFWSDGSGVHVSDTDKNAEGSHNILLNSFGFLLRAARNNLVSITKSAVTFYDGNGNEANNVTAHFGTDNATLGKANDWHSRMDSGGFTIYVGDGEDNIVASFGKKVIALGKGFQDAVIWLCNAKGSISYGRVDGVNSYGMIVNSTDRLFLTATDYLMLQAGSGENRSVIRIDNQKNITLQRGTSISTFLPKQFHMLYSESEKDHYITCEQGEIDILKTRGWNDQGVIFTSFG